MKTFSALRVQPNSEVVYPDLLVGVKDLELLPIGRSASGLPSFFMWKVPETQHLYTNSAKENPFKVGLNWHGHHAMEALKAGNPRGLETLEPSHSANCTGCSECELYTEIAAKLSEQAPATCSLHTVESVAHSASGTFNLFNSIIVSQKGRVQIGNESVIWSVICA